MRFAGLAVIVMVTVVLMMVLGLIWFSPDVQC
jgi:hypothetical protein